MAASLTHLCLLAIICSFGASVAAQDDGFDRLLSQYRQTLENYGVNGDANGANAFLNSLIPDGDAKTEIQELIRGLSSSTYRKREAAEKSLVRKGPPALELLRIAANQGDTETRSRSRRCVAAIELTHQQLVFAAIQIVKLDVADEPTPAQRLETVFRLLRKFKHLKTKLIDVPKSFVDESCQAQIRNGLQDSDHDIRIASIRALSRCFADSELQDFIDLMYDDNAQLALVAVETVGHLQPDNAAKLLIEHLSDPSHSVRQSAASILRTISNEYFAFKADDSGKSREHSIKKWQNWHKSNSPITTKHFARLTTGEASPPIGFLVSVSNSKVCYFDIDGRQIWDQNVAIYDAQYINKEEFIVAERNRDQVRVINREGKTQLLIDNVDSPSDVEMLQNGNVLALSGKGILYEFSDGRIFKTISGMDNPFDADRLPNGNTIVADSGNNRIVIFDPHGRVAWQLPGLPFPNNVHRMPDGRILYTTYTTGDVVMLTSEGDLLWRRNLPGSTLFSVYASTNEVYVADGGNSKIWVLDASGQPTREIQIPVNFCDVDFVTK